MKAVLANSLKTFAGKFGENRANVLRGALLSQAFAALCILNLTTVAFSAPTGAQAIIKEKAKQLRDENNARQGVPPPAPPQPAKPAQPTAAAAAQTPKL